MFDFRKAGQELTALAPIMAGKEKLKTEEVINKQLTIIGVGFARKFDEGGNPIVDDNGEPDTYAVVEFEEMPGYVYPCGTVPTNVFKDFLLQFEGKEQALNDAIKESKGIKVQFSASKTKKGRDCTVIQFL